MANEFNITDAEIEDGKTMGGIAYFGLLGFLIAYLTKKENKYVVYHAQQSLANCILYVIPFIGWIAHVIFMIIGLLKGFQGEIKPLPLIGEIALKFGLLKPAAGSTPPPSTPKVE
jgi:uncharacterized membrane protein